MQTNKHVLRAMVESEEVSLQATAEAIGRDSAVLSATGSSFHSLGARRVNCLRIVVFCPGVFSEGTVSIHYEHSC